MSRWTCLRSGSSIDSPLRFFEIGPVEPGRSNLSVNLKARYGFQRAILEQA
jgi:hypothetical protein